MDGPEERERKSPPEPPAGAQGQPLRWRPLALVGALLVVALLVRVLGLGEMLWHLRLWLISLGPWGPLVFVLLYIVGVVAAIPGTAITIAAGALFGSLLGVVLVSIGATVGGALSFLISRYLAREEVARWLAGNAKFQRLDQLTAEHGAIIVALTRLVPFFPFNVLNYGFGLTRVSFWTFVFWSFLCEIPGTIMYVVGADAVTKAAVEGRLPWPLIGALLLSLILLTILVRFARRQLQSKEAEAGVTPSSGSEENHI